MRSDVAELACLNRSRMSSRQHIWAVEAPIMGRTTASKGQENYLAQQPICTLLRNQTRNIDHSDVTTGLSAPNRGPRLFACIQNDDLDPAILLTASSAVVWRFGARLPVADGCEAIGGQAVPHQEALSRFSAQQREL